jgi:hypothetical protein
MGCFATRSDSVLGSSYPSVREAICRLPTHSPLHFTLEVVPLAQIHSSGSVETVPKRDDVLEHLHSTIHGRFWPAAICIQRFVSSRESASHDTFRTSLRP